MVFVKEKKEAQPSFSVGVTLQRKPTKGDIGIEIEVEANKCPKPPGAAGSHTPVMFSGMKEWSYVHDGSLRGEDNAEYVLTKPLMFHEVKWAIDRLWNKFAKHGTVMTESNRTSVHVHLNCQDFHLNRLTALMALYFTFEEVLTEWCGEHRVGNLFCLRAKDAPAIVTMLKKFVQQDAAADLRDGLHYSGMNSNALIKFGSLEFRSLRGVTDPQTILDWISVLERLYRLSEDFRDPRDICSMFSAEGPLVFFDNILGDKGPIIRKGISFNDEQIRDSMYEGIRIAQDLCYCRDWTKFLTINMKSDPFGRDPRKVMKKLQQQASGVAASIMDAVAGIQEGEETDAVSGWTLPVNTHTETTIALNSYLAQASTYLNTPPSPPDDFWSSDYDENA